MKNALLIVDIQNDFCEGGALEVKKGNEVIPVINRILNKNNFDLIIATQDWHPKEHKSFASNHENKNVYDIIDLNGLKQVLWPEHCVQNSFGAEFHSDLVLPNDVKIFRKGTNINVDSYSGFYENDHKTSTGLAEYLKKENVSDVYIVGLATDYCVKFTALDSVKEGFDTYVISDAVKAVNINPDDEQKALKEMQNSGINIIDSNNIKLAIDK